MQLWVSPGNIPGARFSAIFFSRFLAQKFEEKKTEIFANFQTFRTHQRHLMQIEMKNRRFVVRRRQKNEKVAIFDVLD